MLDEQDTSLPGPSMEPEILRPAWRERDLAKPKKLLPRAALLVLVLFFGGLLVFWLLPTHAPENPLAYDPVTLEPKPPEGLLKKITHLVFSKDIALAGERNDRINILLLGIGGAGHEGPYLSDTMILASIQPSTGAVALVSIPRDLQVEIPGHGLQKINHANAFGEVKQPQWGGALAAEVAEQTFGIDVPYYIRVDFQAFKALVDAVDGITVNVERSFHDPLYPADGFSYQTVSFARGVQTMNGSTALAFVRSRHGSNGEGSDFARSRRQQKVLLALKEKIFSIGTLTDPVKMKDILDALDTHITTNMEFSEIVALVKMGKELSTRDIRSLVLDTSPNGYLVSGTGPDNAFVLVPKSGSFDTINQAIQDIFTTEDIRENEPHTVVAAASKDPGLPRAEVEIQNGTWHAGLAARMKKRLVDTGFRIGPIGNADVRPIERSGIYAIKPSAPNALLEAIRTELHLPFNERLPEGITAASTTEILILLGDDFQE